MKIPLILLVIVSCMIYQCVSSQSQTPTPSCDLNGDGIVDWEDVLLVSKYWHTGKRYTSTPVDTPVPTPTPTHTRSAILPSPANIVVEGDEVPGKHNEFYDTVTISWDPIPNFEVVDSSNLYIINFGYGKDWSGPATVRKATNSTSIVIDIDDSDLEPDSVELAGLIFYVAGVKVTQDGGVFVGDHSPWYWFRLLPRPVGMIEGETRKKPSVAPIPKSNSP